MFVSLIFSSLIFVTFGESDWNWNYDNQEDWDAHFQSCSGKHESPINIDTGKVKVDSSLAIKFFNYDKFFLNSTAQNNGHTVRIFISPDNEDQMPYISGKSVHNEVFILDSFHFHWGETNFNGTEHSINNIHKSAELHLVHWNKIYGSMAKATDEADGLVVVTVFLEIKHLSYSGLNIALTPIIDALSRITVFSKNSRIHAPLSLNPLLPSDRSLFYKYEGSLTTPPCSETATFLIFAHTIGVTSDQLSHFRHLRGEPDDNGVSKLLTHNMRNQQPLNGRIVEASHPILMTNSLTPQIPKISDTFKQKNSRVLGNKLKYKKSLVN